MHEIEHDGYRHMVRGGGGHRSLCDGTVWVSEEYGRIFITTLGGTLLDVVRPPDAFIPKRLNAQNRPVENFSANSPPIGVTTIWVTQCPGGKTIRASKVWP